MNKNNEIQDLYKETINSFFISKIINGKTFKIESNKLKFIEFIKELEKHINERPYGFTITIEKKTINNVISHVVSFVMNNFNIIYVTQYSYDDDLPETILLNENDLTDLNSKYHLVIEEEKEKIRKNLFESFYNFSKEYKHKINNPNFLQCFKEYTIQ